MTSTRSTPAPARSPARSVAHEIGARSHEPGLAAAGEDPGLAEISFPDGVDRAVALALDARLRASPAGGDRRALGAAGLSALAAAVPAATLDALRATWFERRPAALIVRRVIEAVDLPPTPASGFLDDDAVASVDAALLGLCSLLGIEPIAYSFENEGRLFRNVVPNPALAGVESSWGFSTNLHWHQDNNFQPFEFDADRAPGRPPMPRYLVFLSLRNHERVPTQLLPVADVVARLPPETTEALGRPIFTVSPPPSVAGASGSDLPVALLTTRDGCVLSRFDTSDGITARDDGAALEAMRRAVDDHRGGIVSALIEPGDMLVFDNYRVLHRREAFEPHDAAHSRWLRRIYGLTACVPPAGGIEASA